MTSLDLNVSGGWPSVQDMGIKDNILYVVGGLDTVNGSVSRDGAAAFDLSTGIVTSWDPGADWGIYEIEIVGNHAFVAGEFTSLKNGTVDRDRLAKIDLKTGDVRSFNLSVDDDILSLDYANNTLLITGYFTSVGGQARDGVASISAINGDVINWVPNISAFDQQYIGVAKGKAFVGGDFSTSDTIAYDAYYLAYDGWSVNNHPILPSVTGQEEVVYGGSVGPSPTFTFNLDASKDRYRIIIDDSIDFSSPEVDYKSGIIDNNVEQSFNVGQSANGGTYFAGAPSQILPQGDYYWAVGGGDSLSDGEFQVVNDYEVSFSVGGLIFDLDSTDSFDYRIDGPEAYFCYGCWDTGYTVGDINGDGIHDLVVMGYANDGNDDVVYVVFGGNSGRPKITSLADSTSYNIKINVDLTTDRYLHGIYSIDINGDGNKDLVLSHGSSNYGGDTRGSLIVFYSTLLDGYSSSTGNTLSTLNSNDFNLRFKGGSDFEGLGGYEGVHLKGDFDNDDRDDLLLGTSSGAAYLFNADKMAAFGNVRGTEIDLSNSSNFSLKLINSNPNNDMGKNPGGEDKNVIINDVTGDGNNDIVLSDYSSGQTTDGVFFINSSLVQTWNSNGGIYDISQSANHTAHIYDSTKGDYQDFVVIQSGDVNGDGKDDLLLETRQYFSQGPIVIFSNLLSSISGTGNTLNLSVGSSYNLKFVLANQLRSMFPVSIANDWNQDGKNDLVIQDNNGEIYFFFSNLFTNLGTSTGNSWSVPGANFSAKLKSSVLNEKLTIKESYKSLDFDNDGHKDIIIVSEGANHSHSDNNSIYVVNGNKIKNSTTNSVIDLYNPSNYIKRFDTPELADSTYNGMENVGDFNGDGVDDLFIISDATDYNAEDTGAGYILLGTDTSSQLSTYTIQNLPSPMSPRLLSDNSVDLSVTGQSGAVQTRLFSSAIPLADTTVDLTQNRNWSGVNSSIDLSGRKLLITGLTTAPGASATFSMYIPKDAADDKLHVCPGATNLTEITITCNGGYDLTTSSPGVTIFTYLSNTYWKVENSEGLGSVSYKYVESGGGNNNGGDNNNGEENNGGGNNNVNTGDTGTDSDNDGVSDENEVENGTNPQTPDTDSDGLKDGEEVDGCVYTEGSTECGTIIFIPTDPTSPDTDGEGLKDGEEVLGCKFEAGVTECSDVTFPPTNPNETDTDSDGLTDHKEVEIGTNPTDDDTDSDGISDGEEVYGCIYKDGSTECSEITYDSTDPKDPNSFYIPPTDENEGVPTTGANQEDTSSSEGIIASVLSSVQTAAKSGVLPGISVVAAVSAAALTTLAFPNIPLFVILLLRRRNKYAPWGLVSDEINSTPIPFATVRVFNNKGEFVTQEITDLNGKYTGVVNPGTYKLEVKSGGYEASTLGIVLTNDVLNKDIVLSPVGSNGFHFKKFLRANLKLINRMLFYLGLTLATLTLIYAFSLLNLVIFLAFVAEAILFFFIGRSRAGVVYDTSTGDHLKGVFLTVTDMNGNQIGTTVSDKKGKYSALLQKGTYQLKVYLDNFTLGDKDVSGRDAKGNPYSSLVIKENGILNKQLGMKKSPTENNSPGKGFGAL